jgi:hypothetical protein
MKMKMPPLRDIWAYGMAKISRGYRAASNEGCEMMEPTDIDDESRQGKP